MEKTAYELMQFSSADGELRLDAGGRTDEELLSIAAKTSRSGRRLVITNVTGAHRELLERMAIAGKRNVLFDLR